MSLVNFFDRDLRLAAKALENDRPALADRLLSDWEAREFAARGTERLTQIWPLLARARRRRRELAAGGRIDLHTHTTASDGEFPVDRSLRSHFVCGQILINDHNIIDSLADARRIVRDYDLNLDVFLGIEVICTHERRAFECNVIAPALTESFTRLCREHREYWSRACELFVRDLVERDDFFQQPLWTEIANDYAVGSAGGSFEKIVQLYDQVRQRISADFRVYAAYLHNNQTFDMGQMWHAWKLGSPGDPPMLAHRFFAAMRSYAMNAYRRELGDWFDYPTLMSRFHDVGCFISHNHPNYWDDDFIGELPFQLQTEWVTGWAKSGTIDALEVWSPPFASKRVPHYWENVCHELGVVPMAGTDCHSGKEEAAGGRVENHPEIPPQIYAILTRQAVAEARRRPESWQAMSAWREVLAIDYANEAALRWCEQFATRD